MEMVKMITISEHVYAGRQLKSGDEFDCESVHVHLMQTLGRARKAEVPAQEVTQKYRTRDMTAKRRQVKG
jgi:hypothetical protein